jgi:hypothetical protein
VLKRRLRHAAAADEQEAFGGQQATQKRTLHSALDPAVSRTERHGATVLLAGLPVAVLEDETIANGQAVEVGAMKSTCWS